VQNYRFDLTPSVITVDDTVYFTRLCWTKGAVITFYIPSDDHTSLKYVKPQKQQVVVFKKLSESAA